MLHLEARTRDRNGCPEESKGFGGPSPQRLPAPSDLRACTVQLSGDGRSRFAKSESLPFGRGEARPSALRCHGRRNLLAVIEMMRFRLSAGVEDGEFLLADRAVQEEFAYQQPGLLRRTTARGGDGSWIVVDLWRSHKDADACEAKWGDDPIAQRFMNLVDKSTVKSERYTERD